MPVDASRANRAYHRVSRWTALSLPAVAGLLTSLGCSAEDPSPLATQRLASVAPGSEATAHSGLLVRHTRAAPALRAAQIAEVQQNAGPLFRVERTDTGELRAANRTMAFESRFDVDGVRIGSAGADGWEVGIRAGRFGCAGETEGVSIVVPTAEENRVSFAHADLVEWYLNGPLGLEQGFTIPEAPACARAGNSELAIELSLMGAQATTTPDGDAILLTGDDLSLRLLITDLWVTDATGQHLAARMAAAGQVATIFVDVSQATYPVVIDPLIWAEQQKLLPGDGVDRQHFGTAVSVSNDTALVGASGDSNYSGAAYVFVRSGTT